MLLTWQRFLAGDFEKWRDELTLTLFCGMQFWRAPNNHYRRPTHLSMR